MNKKTGTGPINSRGPHLKQIGLGIFLAIVLPFVARAETPNIVLIMADDQGWGQTGYRNHPVLKTPNIDAMARSGLRFDRFYASAPVCSPTRASVLTGRSNMRTGVESHGYALRLQEKTLSKALRNAGYATGHFGKWHLNGIRGPGVPVLASDSHHPGVFGFDQWLSVTNFFDRDPIMSRMGDFVELQGDSSEIVVAAALEFIRQQSEIGKPSLSVIWFGTPHSPFRASAEDKSDFRHLDARSANHYGELVAMDRAIGTLRQGLRALNVADDTLIWFCSDNGGLPKIEPPTVGGLRGFKGSLYEGGLRVPAIVEWPGYIKEPRVTQFPAVVMDIFPTLAEIVGLSASDMLQPQDGISLKRLLTQEMTRREKPIPFHCFATTALLDNDYKLIRFENKEPGRQHELYDLSSDGREEVNLYDSRPRVAARMRALLTEWHASMKLSYAGKDYAEQELLPENPKPRFWMEIEGYQPFFADWYDRPEYKSRLRPYHRSD